MPVGQDVTPTRRIGPAATATGAGAAVATGEAAAAVATVAAGPAAAAAADAGAAAGAGSRATSASVVAAARAALKSFFMRARASLGSICMCASPPPSGAAMRKTRVAGPSLAPQSIPSVERPNTRDGSVIAALRACGMPMPPGSPVAILLSRSVTSARNASRSVQRPLATSRSARVRVAAWRSAPVRSRTTCSSVMRGMVLPFVSTEGAGELRRAGDCHRYAVEVIGGGDAASGEGDRGGTPGDGSSEGGVGGESARQAVQQSGEHAVPGAHGGQGSSDRRPGVDDLVSRDEEGAVAAEAHGDDLDAVGDQLAGGGVDVAEGR